MVTSAWGRATSFPVFALGGEQGSDKTTMTRMLRAIVDPSAVPALALQKDERDLFTLAQSAHVLSFDDACSAMVSVSVTSPAFIVVHSFQAMM